jgi:DNA replication licensing factor MCM6
MLAEQGSSEGLKRSDVVAWYLEQVQDQIETEEELLERKALVEKVIDRLIYHVSYCNFFLNMKVTINIRFLN